MDVIVQNSSRTAPRIAVLVPCYKEAATIADVVQSFSQALPSATVYVYDNISSDHTGKIATRAAAVVRSELRQGKGYVVSRMFADIEADIYLMVDGDHTYDAAAAPALVAHLVENRLDFVNGARQTTQQKAYRPGHRFATGC